MPADTNVIIRPAPFQQSKASSAGSIHALRALARGLLIQVPPNNPRGNLGRTCSFPAKMLSLNVNGQSTVWTGDGGFGAKGDYLDTAPQGPSIGQSHTGRPICAEGPFAIRGLLLLNTTCRSAGLPVTRQIRGLESRHTGAAAACGVLVLLLLRVGVA